MIKAGLEAELKQTADDRTILLETAWETLRALEDATKLATLANNFMKSRLQAAIYVATKE